MNEVTNNKLKKLVKSEIPNLIMRRIELAELKKLFAEIEKEREKAKSELLEAEKNEYLQFEAFVELIELTDLKLLDCSLQVKQDRLDYHDPASIDHFSRLMRDVEVALKSKALDTNAKD